MNEHEIACWLEWHLDHMHTDPHWVLRRLLEILNRIVEETEVTR